MENGIKIKKKRGQMGENGSRIVSIRMREALFIRLEDLSARTNRSRNELINLLLDSAMDIVKVEE